MISIDGQQLLARLHEFGRVGRSPEGMLSRVALTERDAAGRDLLVRWMEEAGLQVQVDRIGNIFGTLAGVNGSSDPAGQPVMMGSHVDTVVDAGIYDGVYGVLAGIEVVRTLKAMGTVPETPVTVAAFTNEEGIRYTPDMLGSLVHAGGLPLEEALSIVGHDGSVLGEELARIGYAGTLEPGTIRPLVFVELHVEQGPVLYHEEKQIGVVEAVQAISWQRIDVKGQANHAGTTPMALRRDAGYAASRIVSFLHSLAERSGQHTVATAGRVELEPNAINVIPGRAVVSVDIRDPDDATLTAAEQSLQVYLAELALELQVEIRGDQLARFNSVAFDPSLLARIEESARSRALRSRRMISGAGHDAQMMARICPSAMIFVPSTKGISHNPDEHTTPEQLLAGANVLLDVVGSLAGVARGQEISASTNPAP